MRIIANFRKGEEARFISHLDIQRLMQRAMRRAQIPLKYSQGFNPHPLLAFASALSVGFTSDAEWMDVKLTAPVLPEQFVSDLNAALPEGLRILRAKEIEEGQKPLTALMQQADYAITLYPESNVSEEACIRAIEALMGGEIVVMKRTKGGMKNVDIRPHLLDIRLVRMGERELVFDVEGILNAAGGLQIPLLMQAYMERLGINGRIDVHRTNVKFDLIEV